MARKGQSGWYCDVPSELKAEFELRFPGRSKKRNVTIWAIRKMIEEYDKHHSTSTGEPTADEQP